MTSAVRVSVVIAVHNGEAFIGDAIDSVLAQRVPLDLCVVDDGSSDGTGDVVRRFSNVRYVRSSINLGQAAALNRGVSETDGSYLAFLDADDVWMNDKLERQLAAFSANPGLDAVYGLVRERVLVASDSLARRDGAVQPAYLPSALLIKRASFERVGTFATEYTLGSVVDWYARSREIGLSQHVVPHVVYERRIHGDNTGLKQARNRSDYLRALKAALDRRRARG